MSSSFTLSHSSRSQIRSGAQRASYDWDKVAQLVDDLKLGHFGFVVDGEPRMLPMTVWRIGTELYFHSHNKCRLQKALQAGQCVSLSFAQCQEWVLAKSAYHHSANYRSAVLYCSGSRITDDEEFDRVFAALIEQIQPGRWQQVRPPSPQERKGTVLMKLKVEEGAFKSREGGPNDKAEDLALPVWAGTVPL